MLMKNSSDVIGNRTRELPACSAVPQPTAPRRGSDLHTHSNILMLQITYWYVYIVNTVGTVVVDRHSTLNFVWITCNISEVKEETAEFSSLSQAALITVQFDTILGSSADSNAMRVSTWRMRKDKKRSCSCRFWRTVPEFAWGGWWKSWQLQSGWLVSGPYFNPVPPEYGARALTTGKGSTPYFTFACEQKSTSIRAINDNHLAVRLFVRLPWTRLISEKHKLK
jgi:hypothetical protein